MKVQITAQLNGLSTLCDHTPVYLTHAYTVSKKTTKIIFVITMSNFHQIRQFLA